METMKRIDGILDLHRKLIKFNVKRHFVEHRFAAVVQMYGEEYWAGLKRGLKIEEGAHVLYVSPMIGKQAMRELDMPDLVPVFAIMPCALLTSNDFGKLVNLLKKVEQTMLHSFVVAGKLDNLPISGPELLRLAAGPSEQELRVELLKTLVNSSNPVSALSAQSRRLVGTMKRQSQGLAAVLDNHVAKSGEDGGASIASS